MSEFEKILNLPSPIQEIFEPLFEKKKVRVFVKRDDLIHSEISGNKWRKLKYNLLKTNELDKKSILTFGGAFSNHIYAVAAAGKHFGFETIGIIRGDELNENSSKTLKFASDCGMKLIFVSRNDFRVLREIQNIDDLKKNEYINKYPIPQYLNNTIIIPEGGTNDFALKGGYELVDEIIDQLGFKPTTICTAVGTGGTLAGICSNFHEEILPIGIAVLKKAEYIFENIRKLLTDNNLQTFHWEGFLEYQCGGYGKTTHELINFIKKFEEKHKIKLEQVYTGKMFFAIYKLIEENWFQPNSTIVLLHTGGLQGRNTDILD